LLILNQPFKIDSDNDNDNNDNFDQKRTSSTSIIATDIKAHPTKPNQTQPNNNNKNNNSSKACLISQRTGQKKKKKNKSLPVAAKKMDAIPPELQLPAVVVVGILFFLIVLGLSKLSATKDADSKTTKKEKVDDDDEVDASSPVKTRKSGRLASPKGTLMTPGGRRSARLRKED